MRTLLLAVIAATFALPAMAQRLGYDDVREGYDSTVFIYPTVRLKNGRYYPVHAGDGIDYCRYSGFRRARERRGRFVSGGLARHKGGRWQFTFDGHAIRRLRCF